MLSADNLLMTAYFILAFHRKIKLPTLM